MSDESILEEVREAFDYCVLEWEDIRQEGKKDVLCAANGPWSDDERKQRTAAQRPCLSLDELGQYTNQAVNDVRQNKRAIKVIPEGNGANDLTAQKNAAIIRGIEYASNAQAAYIGGFESMILRGYGVWKLSTKFDKPTGFDQRLCITAIANPDTIYLDPDAKEPDWGDMGYGFEVDRFSEKKFKKRWPKAEIHSFTSEHIEAAPRWVGGESVQVASYWKVDKNERELLLIDWGESGPGEHYRDELPPGTKVQDSMVIIKLNGVTHKVPLLNHRKTEDPEVCQYITNGVEILEKNPTKWTEVPLIPVFGKELFVDEGGGAKRRLISMIRMARDAYMLYCYYRTCEAEVAGMSPKILWMGYEGQFATNTPWDKINKTNIPFAEVKARTTATGAEVLPLPQRQPYDPPIQSLEMGAESARRAIQSAMGVSGMLSGNRGQDQEAKSGIALKELDSQTSQSNFHFVDNYDRALERTGRMLQKAIKWCYDTERDVVGRTPDDEHESLHINGPVLDEDGNPKLDAKGEPVPQFNTDEGDHQTTITVGPSQQSQRDAANDFAQSLMQMKGVPPKVISLAVKLQNLGPIGDQIAKAFDPEPDPTDPGQMQQQIAELTQKLQTTQQFAQGLHEAAERKDAELQAKANQAAMENAMKRYTVDQQELTKRTLGLATIDQTDAITKLQEELNIIHRKVDMQHEKEMAAGAQAHEAGMASQAQDAAATAQASDQDAAREAQGADQAHEADQADQDRGAAAESQESAQQASAEQAALAQDAARKMAAAKPKPKPKKAA